MKKYLKITVQWSLAIMIALALKYGALFTYSAFKFRSVLTPEERAAGKVASLQRTDQPLQYQLWDRIVYF